MLGDYEASEILALDVLSDSGMNDDASGSGAQAARRSGRERIDQRSAARDRGSVS